MSRFTKEHKKVMGAGLIGNSLELYDFSLFGYFAAILANQFFSSENPLNSLLMTYGIFASGFLLRPLGALYFGVIGDRYGRKKALTLSIMLMAIPTALIGFLPTYYQIGILAPLLLTLMRMLQGFSVGGELVGSYAYLVEHAPASKRAFMGSWTVVGNFGGKLLGTLAVGLMWVIFSTETLEAWGWRLPFIFGLFLAYIGYYLISTASESPVFQKMIKENKTSRTPIRDTLKTAKKRILQASGTLVIQTTALYLLFVYLPVYLKTELGIPYQYAVFSNFVAIIIVMILLPFSGMLSDQVGRKPVLFIGSFLITLFAVPGFWLINYGTLPMIFFAHWTLAIIFSLAHGPMPALFVEIFQPKVRFTASAISYNVSVGIFGGLTPFICTWLVGRLDSPLAPAYWLVATGIISLLTLLTVQETRQIDQLESEPLYG